MSTSLPPSPTIPLSADARAAYKDLYAKIEAEIENTTDVVALEALNPLQAQIDDVLDKDELYQLAKNTENFNAALKQLNDTNAALKTLQTQIGQTASHFKTAATILGAVTKVFGFLGLP